MTKRSLAKLYCLAHNFPTKQANPFGDHKSQYKSQYKSQ